MTAIGGSVEGEGEGVELTERFSLLPPVVVAVEVCAEEFSAHRRTKQSVVMFFIKQKYQVVVSDLV
jgi:hypothetical protein